MRRSICKLQHLLAGAWRLGRSRELRKQDRRLPHKLSSQGVHRSVPLEPVAFRSSRCR
jgi:hypothetical protein